MTTIITSDAPKALQAAVLINNRQLQTALSLAEAAGHEWATHAMADWSPLGEGPSAVTLADITANTQEGRRRDEFAPRPHGVEGPTAEWRVSPYASAVGNEQQPELGFWLLVHTTCTGGTEWEIYPDGSARIRVYDVHPEGIDAYGSWDRLIAARRLVATGTIGADGGVTINDEADCPPAKRQRLEHWLAAASGLVGAVV